MLFSFTPISFANPIRFDANYTMSPFPLIAFSQTQIAFLLHKVCLTVSALFFLFSEMSSEDIYMSAVSLIGSNENTAVCVFSLRFVNARWLVISHHEWPARDMVFLCFPFILLMFQLIPENRLRSPIIR